MALDGRGGGVPKTVAARDKLAEQRNAGTKRSSPKVIKNTQHMASQSSDNLRSSRRMSQRSKLEKLREIDGNQASESEEPIFLSEEEQDKQRRTIIDMASPQVGQITNSQEASESKKIRICSELSSPLRKKSTRKPQAEDGRTEELREEYLRLQQELELLKGNQSLQSAR